MKPKTTCWPDVSPRARRAIDRFQDYVVGRYQSREQKWVSAKPLVQAIADAIVADLATNEPPIDLDPIAKKLGVRAEYRNSTTKHFTAILESTQNGFLATLFRFTNQRELRPGSIEARFDYTDNCATHRERFTLAHEIGHTFFYRVSSLLETPKRIVPLPHGGFSKRGRRDESSTSSRREEALCHDFARALLFPSECREMVSDCPQLEYLASLCRTFRTNHEPVLRRILYDFDLWKSAVFYRVSHPYRGDRPYVQTFRGSARRRQSDKSPKKNDILEMVAGAQTTEEIFETLQDKYCSGANEIAQLGASVWIMYQE